MLVGRTMISGREILGLISTWLDTLIIFVTMFHWICLKDPYGLHASKNLGDFPMSLGNQSFLPRNGVRSGELCGNCSDLRWAKDSA